MLVTSCRRLTLGALLCAGAACDPAAAQQAQTALVFDHGSALQIFIADGAQSCADPMVPLIAERCSNPSWQLVVSASSRVAPTATRAQLATCGSKPVVLNEVSVALLPEQSTSDGLAFHLTAPPNGVINASGTYLARRCPAF